MHFDPEVPLLGIYPKKLKTLIQKKICTTVFNAALFTIANLETAKVPNIVRVDKKRCGTQIRKIHIIFKCTWNIFKDRPKIGHKTSLNKFKKIEIISTFFIDHKGLKLLKNLKKKIILKNTQTHGDWIASD